MSPTAVITGASAGIGRELAKTLAAQGWRIIGTGRDPGRIAAAQAEIGAAAVAAGFQAGSVEIIAADLSLMQDVEVLARRIAELTDRVQLLVNNAGGLANATWITSEGLEGNFAGNHLGPFLLTELLLPLLRTAARDLPAGTVRILNTSSNVSEMIPSVDFDDLQGLKNFNPGLAYCTSKLANALFTRALADRLGNEGIVAHAVHPGAVASNFFAHASDQTMEALKKYEVVTPAEGADTLVWLVTAEKGATHNGSYWHKRQLRTPNPVVNDRSIRERLWEESERLIATARLG